MQRRTLMFAAAGGVLAAGGAAAQSGSPQLKLSLSRQRLAVVRLDAGEAIPPWALALQGLSSISRTRDELSIVCDEGAVPAGRKVEGGWRVFKIDGPLDFGLTGILASVLNPLAQAGVSIFALSTYDTDYVMVKHDKIDAALAALRGAGHTVTVE